MLRTPDALAAGSDRNLPAQSSCDHLAADLLTVIRLTRVVLADVLPDVGTEQLVPLLSTTRRAALGVVLRADPQIPNVVVTVRLLVRRVYPAAIP